MSHFVSVQTSIRDIEAVHAAARELGLQVIPNTVARGYRGALREFPFVLKCTGAYDVGLERNADGTWGIVADWYEGDGGTVAKQIGEQGKRLLQLYGVHKATIEARKKGLNVQRVPMGNGSIKLQITGARL